MILTPENSRTLGLVHFQSLRFKRKLDSALAAVTAALQSSRRPYVAFSGGKDSTAVCGLVHALAPDTPLVYGDDELELPETTEYLAKVKRAAGAQLTILNGWSCHAGWFWPWTDRPFWREPHPESLWSVRDEAAWLAWQARQRFGLVFLGLRGNENRKRRDWLLQVGPLYGAKSTVSRRCSPIHDWTEDDVWALIHAWGLGYNRAYDVMDACGMDRHRQRVGPLPLASRWQLAEGWPDVLARLEARYGPRWE